VSEEELILKPRRPAFAVRVKGAIEKAVGLPISDSLNLALFILTILSLFAAFVGVWLAKQTLDDARQSGAEQTLALKQQIKIAGDSQAALSTASESLKALQQQITKQQSLIEQQTSIQSSTLKTARQELERQLDKERQRPDVRLAIFCSGQFYFDWNALGKIGHAASIDLPVDGQTNRPISEFPCRIEVYNFGTASVSRARFHLEVSDAEPESLIRARWFRTNLGQLTVLNFDRDEIVSYSLSMGPETFPFLLEVSPEVENFTLRFEVFGSNLEKVAAALYVSAKRPKQP
jgi:hypothetical protein